MGIYTRTYWFGLGTSTLEVSKFETPWQVGLPSAGFYPVCIHRVAKNGDFSFCFANIKFDRVLKIK